MDLPLAAGTDMNSAVQLEGIRNTYGKRYTFCAITGVTPEDDIDGADVDIGKEDPLIPQIKERWQAILDTGYKPRPEQKKAMASVDTYTNGELKKFADKVDKLYSARVVLNEIGLLFSQMGFTDKDNQKSYIWGALQKDKDVAGLSLEDRIRLRDMLKADVEKEKPSE